MLPSGESLYRRAADRMHRWCWRSGIHVFASIELVRDLLSMREGG
jgi:hypothetical protein